MNEPAAKDLDLKSWPRTQAGRLARSAAVPQADAVAAWPGCYWERTSPGGEILDNQFTTHAVAVGITVTIRPTDGSFTTERLRHLGTRAMT